jgi:hypothetical protein
VTGLRPSLIAIAEGDGDSLIAIAEGDGDSLIAKAEGDGDPPTQRIFLRPARTPAAARSGGSASARQGLLTSHADPVPAGSVMDTWIVEGYKGGGAAHSLCFLS